MKKLGVMGSVEEQEWNEITTAEIKDALINSPKWKSPGTDKKKQFQVKCF